MTPPEEGVQAETQVLYNDISGYAEIHANLYRRRLGFRFSPDLERSFHEHHAMESARTFRSTLFYVLLLYAALGIGIIVIVPFEVLELWPIGYLGIGLIILAGAVLSRNKHFDRHYELQVGGLAFVGTALLIVLPFLIEDPVVHQLAFIGVIHGLVVVGAALGLRFKSALIAMVGGGITGFLLVLIAGSSADWLLVHRTFTGGCLIGAFLAWLSEKRSRQVFLQTRLLAMEKARSDALAEQMRDMSQHDTLTGLANRRYFDEVLEKEWLRCRRDGTPLSLLFIDVDFFKPFNDHYGHPHGDVCLRMLADTFLAFARRPGDFAGRYGGEEFVLLFPQMSQNAASELAGEILKAVSDLSIEHCYSKVADHVTVSIGVSSVVPEPGGFHPEQLLKAADHAMYLAKREGRNRFRVYQPEGAQDFNVEKGDKNAPTPA